MIAFLSLCYASFYLLFFNKLKIFEKNARNISIFVGVGVVLIGSIVFMWLTYAPTTKDGRTFQYVVQIIPNVSGPVTEVPARPLAQMREGDVLFRIDPTQYQAAVDQTGAGIRQAQARKCDLGKLQYGECRGAIDQSDPRDFSIT